MDDHGATNNNARRLARLLITTPDQQDCERCLDGLEPYVQAQIAGAARTTELDAVAAHLDQCVACAEAYAVLYETLLDPSSLPETAVPEPDLSFLDRAPGPLTPAQLRARLLDQQRQSLLATAMAWTGEHLRLNFSEPLLRLLTPAPGPNLALRGVQPDDRLFELELADPNPAIARLQLTALSSGRDAASCNLRVQVMLSGREWPDLAEIPVTLSLPDQQRHAVTDPWGEVIFADLPTAVLAQMQIVIEPTPLGESDSTG